MYPLAILAFNRPHYLKQFLDSLVEATKVTPVGEISIFLDGQRKDADIPLVDECELIFKSHFPNGKIFKSETNLGIAMNYDRAEKYVFEELGADYAYFFEDDLVIGPGYIEALNQILELMKLHPQIAYGAAYGESSYMNGVRSKNSHSLDTLGHQWGYIASKVSHDEIKADLAEYKKLFSEVSYSEKEIIRDEIQSLFREWGSDFDELSQDCAKAISLIKHGYIKVNTNFNLGYYIGAIGEHMTQDKFDLAGFESTDELKFAPCQVTTDGNAVNRLLEHLKHIYRFNK